MFSKFALLLAFIVLSVVEAVTRKRRNLAALQAFGRARQWEMLLIDGCLSRKVFGSDLTLTYRARYRTSEEHVHEAVLEVSSSGVVTLLEDQRLPPKLVRQMADINLPMDCRRCGSRVESGCRQCPYCRAWRGGFKSG